MRIHDNEYAESLRPRSSRVESKPSSEALRAAAAGRADALDPAGVLGLQRAVGNAGVGSLMEEDRSPVHDVVSSGGGSALSEDVRGEMQGRLGHDFSDVRVHTDGAAADSAASVNAHAYTVGNNIVFQRDKFDTSSTEGKTMLAHELTHVVQQRSGPVDGADAGGGIKVSDPSDRFEREASANAESVMSTPAPAHQHAPEGASPGAAVQRDAEQDEELQGAFVQRDEAPPTEDEEPVEEPGGAGAAVQRDVADDEDQLDE